MSLRGKKEIPILIQNCIQDVYMILNLLLQQHYLDSLNFVSKNDK